MDEQTTQMPGPPTTRERDASNIVRTAADWLRAKGWRRNERNRWQPTEHEFTMYQAALMQKGFDDAEAFEA
jgi:hypothetical protein